MMKNEESVIDKERLMAHTNLTADLVDGTVVISSSNKGSVNLPKGSPPERFTFNLTDNTGLNVKFLAAPGFLCVDETGGCPPAGSGINSDQISNVGSSGRTAEFTDLNSRPCTLGYALYFSCDNGSTPGYDPIIINGGPANK